MDRGRRQKGEFRHQQFQATRSNYWKPSQAQSQTQWQPKVPTWERDFCTSVGLPWKRFLEAKKFVPLYDKIIKWNDSAVEEAFHNAKNRYWAMINSLPCEISLPDPNIYIDEVDWDAEVDPELLQDLDKEYVPDDKYGNERVVFIGDALVPEYLFSHANEYFPKDDDGGWGNGWGDSWQGNNNTAWWDNGNYDKWLNNDNKPIDSWQDGNKLADSWQDGNYKEVGHWLNNDNKPIDSWQDGNKLADSWQDGNYKEVGHWLNNDNKPIDSWQDGNKLADSWQDGNYKEVGNDGNKPTNSWEEGYYQEGGNDGCNWADLGRDGNNAVNYKDWGNRCSAALQKADNRRTGGYRGKSSHWNNNNGRNKGGRGGGGASEMSRYKTSRFHGNDDQTDRGWRTRREWRKSRFVDGKPSTDGNNSSKHCN